MNRVNRTRPGFERHLTAQHRRFGGWTGLVLAGFLVAACATTRRPEPPHYPETLPTPGATGDKPNQPPIAPEADPENVERRFGFEEARQRKEQERKRKEAAEKSKKRIEHIEQPEKP